MGFFANIREKVSSAAERAAEKRRFLALVDDETLPLRRKGYLEEKKRLAAEEGRKLARKEIKKEPTRDEFNLNIGGKNGK